MFKSKGKKLRDAAEAGDLSLVEDLLKRGARINSYTNGFVPNPITGKAIEGSTRLGHTALIKAVRKQRHAVVEYLIQQGASLSETATRCRKMSCEGDYLGATPLALAVMNRDLSMVKLLVLADKKQIDTEVGFWYYGHNRCRLTPLMMAIVLRKTDIAQYLIQAGANLEKKGGDDQRTALMLAAQEGQVSVVKELIAKGADAKLRDKSGKTLLQLASGAAFKYLNAPNQKAKDSRDKASKLIFDGAGLGEVEKLQESLGIEGGEGRSTLLRGRDDAGQTALHLAAQGGWEEATLFLLEQKAPHTAKVNKAGIRHGNTPLHDAARLGHAAVVKLLMIHGASPAATNELGETPHSLALAAGHEDVVAILSGKEPKRKVSSSSQQAALLPANIGDLQYDPTDASSRLGSGGFGDVHKGRWQGLDVAVKQLHLNTEETRLALLDESELMIRLRHKHVVQLYAVRSDQAPYCMVMEYMANGSLAQLLFNGKPLDANTSVRLAKETTMGVSYLHAQGIVHRDIKPDNVLLDEHNAAKVSDFGLSRLKEETSSQGYLGQSVTGTVAYMACELLLKTLNGELEYEYNEKTDMYSLGVLFWAMATQQKPFGNAKNQMAIMFAASEGKLADVPETTSPVLKTAMHSCLFKDPEQRPNAKAVLTQLSQINAVGEVSASGPCYLEESQAVMFGRSAQSVMDDSDFSASGPVYLDKSCG